MAKRWTTKRTSAFVVAGHPRADVRGTVAKHNSPTGFAGAQKADGFPVREDQIRKVEHDRFAGRHMSSD